MQTRVAVVVFPTQGGPDSKAALNIEPSSFPAIKSEKNKYTINYYTSFSVLALDTVNTFFKKKFFRNLILRITVLK